MPTHAALHFRLYNQTLVQIATTWPSSDMGWDTLTKVFCKTAADGLANDVGTAELYQPGGNVIWPGEDTPEILLPLDIVGVYVRILKENKLGTGAISDTLSGKTFDPIWYGKITSRKWTPNKDETGLDIIYTCAGILFHLDQMVPFTHLERSNTGLVADITEPMEFNPIGEGKKGKRSAATSLVEGSNVFVFDRDNDDKWLAIDVIQYLLALIKQTNPGGPSWALAGLTSALNYSEKWDIGGMTVLEAISRLVSPRQGLGYRLEMSGFNPTIYVMSLSKTAVGAGTFTLPASVDTATLDLTDPTEIVDFSLTETQTAKYGRVAVIGGPHMFIMTLQFNADGSGQIVRDWEDADETAAEADVADDLPVQGHAARAFRRFKIRDDWNGQNYAGSFTMPTLRQVDTNTLNGDDGYTGVLGTGGEMLQGNKHVIARDLPIPTGYEWDTQDPTLADFNQRHDEPKVFVFTTEGDYVTLAEYTEKISCEISIDEHTGALTLGADLIEDIKAIIDNNEQVFFTLCIHAPIPMMVSWNGVSLDQPVEQFQSIARQRSHFMRKVITQDTIFRATAGFANTRLAQEVVHDDTDEMKAILALAVAWYGRSDWELSWSKKGEISTNYGKPGTLYTSVDYTDYPGHTATQDLEAVVTRREWDFSDGAGITKVSTKRIKVDIETVF